MNERKWRGERDSLIENELFDEKLYFSTTEFYRSFIYYNQRLLSIYLGQSSSKICNNDNKNYLKTNIKLDKRNNHETKNDEKLIVLKKDKLKSNNILRFNLPFNFYYLIKEKFIENKDNNFDNTIWLKNFFNELFTTLIFLIMIYIIIKWNLISVINFFHDLLLDRLYLNKRNYKLTSQSFSSDYNSHHEICLPYNIYQSDLIKNMNTINNNNNNNNSILDTYEEGEEMRVVNNRNFELLVKLKKILNDYFGVITLSNKGTSLVVYFVLALTPITVYLVNILHEIEFLNISYRVDILNFIFDPINERKRILEEIDEIIDKLILTCKEKKLYIKQLIEIESDNLQANEKNHLDSIEKSIENQIIIRVNDSLYQKFYDNSIQTVTMSNSKIFNDNQINTNKATPLSLSKEIKLEHKFNFIIENINTYLKLFEKIKKDKSILLMPNNLSPQWHKKVSKNHFLCVIIGFIVAICGGCITIILNLYLEIRQRVLDKLEFIECYELHIHHINSSTNDYSVINQLNDSIYNKFQMKPIRSIYERNLYLKYNEKSNNNFSYNESDSNLNNLFNEMLYIESIDCFENNLLNISEIIVCIILCSSGILYLTAIYLNSNLHLSKWIKKIDYELTNCIKLLYIHRPYEMLTYHVNHNYNNITIIKSQDDRQNMSGKFNINMKINENKNKLSQYYERFNDLNLFNNSKANESFLTKIIYEKNNSFSDRNVNDKVNTSIDDQLFEILNLTYLEYELFRRQQTKQKELAKYFIFRVAIFSSIIIIWIYLIGTTIKSDYPIVILSLGSFISILLNVYLIISAKLTNDIEKLIKNITTLIAASKYTNQYRLSFVLDLWRRQLTTVTELRKNMSPDMFGVYISWGRLLQLDASILALWLLILQPR